MTKQRFESLNDSIRTLCNVIDVLRIADKKEEVDVAVKKLITLVKLLPTK